MSLKEIKARIASVSNTRKTTSAMKMVSSVKLRKAQQAVQSSLPYVEQLDNILNGLASMPDLRCVPMLCERTVHRVAIIVVSSDSSLCGGFNANIIRHSSGLYYKCRQEYGTDPLLYTIGLKVTEHYRKQGVENNSFYSNILARREYQDAASLADDLMAMFANNTIDKVILCYTHFKTAGTQRIVEEQLLPVSLHGQDDSGLDRDFILEPSADGLLSTLLPQVIRMRLYTALLDSFCSEQAARVIAMQAATDNADNLIGELTLQYNKLRQQAITNELLDLAGGQIENR